MAIWKWPRCPQYMQRNLVTKIGNTTYGVDVIIEGNLAGILIQSNAIITWSNIVRYCIYNYRDWGGISNRCSIHKRHPIPRPNVYVWGFRAPYIRDLMVNICEKINRVITAPHCMLWAILYHVGQFKKENPLHNHFALEFCDLLRCQMLVY